MIVLEGDWRSWDPLAIATAVTVGVYDGVHRGHRHVLRVVAEEASGLPLVVVTFRENPAKIINPAGAPLALTTIEQRLELLADLGVYAAAVIDFDEDFRELSPEEFVEQVIVDKLSARLVAVGDDFRFGYRQRGDVALLTKLGTEYGFTVCRVPILEDNGPVRSTAIRSALAEGDVARARHLLGRPYRLQGTVVSGDRRGRTLGFPTANLEIARDVVIPASGVYAVEVIIGDDVRPGVVNIGTHPTFGGEVQMVEVHVLDFNGDLYGSTVGVDFIARLRGEKKFAGIDELVGAIRDDIARSRKIMTEEE